MGIVKGSTVFFVGAAGLHEFRDDLPVSGSFRGDLGEGVLETRDGSSVEGDDDGGTGMEVAEFIESSSELSNLGDDLGALDDLFLRENERGEPVGQAVETTDGATHKERSMFVGRFFPSLVQQTSHLKVLENLSI